MTQQLKYLGSSLKTSIASVTELLFNFTTVPRATFGKQTKALTDQLATERSHMLDAAGTSLSNALGKACPLVQRLILGGEVRRVALERLGVLCPNLTSMELPYTSISAAEFVLVRSQQLLPCLSELSFTHARINSRLPNDATRRARMFTGGCSFPRVKSLGLIEGMGCTWEEWAGLPRILNNLSCWEVPLQQVPAGFQMLSLTNLTMCCGLSGISSIQLLYILTSAGNLRQLSGPPGQKTNRIDLLNAFTMQDKEGLTLLNLFVNRKGLVLSGLTLWAGKRNTEGLVHEQSHSGLALFGELKHHPLPLFNTCSILSWTAAPGKTPVHLNGLSHLTAVLPQLKNLELDGCWLMEDHKCLVGGKNLRTIQIAKILNCKSSAPLLQLIAQNSLLHNLMLKDANGVASHEKAVNAERASGSIPQHACTLRPSEWNVTVEFATPRPRHGPGTITLHIQRITCKHRGCCTRE